MTGTATHATAVAESTEQTDDSPGATALIELLGDDYVREFLAVIGDEAKPAREIARACDASRTTVYRRLNRLRDAGLVTEGMEYGAGGHHRRTFAAAVDRVAIGLDEDGFVAAVETDG